MKTIDDYTIYSTEEQTKKALALGAPFIKASSLDALMNKPYFIHDNAFVVIPTAEQVICWLEDNYFGSIEPCISGESIEEWGYTIFDKSMNLVLWHSSEERQLHSRPEATLDAIDAALDYLTK